MLRNQKRMMILGSLQESFLTQDQPAARPKSSSTTQTEVLTSTALEAWFTSFDLPGGGELLMSQHFREIGVV